MKNARSSKINPKSTQNRLQNHQKSQKMKIPNKTPRKTPNKNLRLKKGSLRGTPKSQKIIKKCDAKIHEFLSTLADLQKSSFVLKNDAKTNEIPS